MYVMTYSCSFGVMQQFTEYVWKTNNYVYMYVHDCTSDISAYIDLLLLLLLLLGVGRGGCCMVTVVKTFKSKEAEDEYALTQLLACDLKSHCWYQNYVYVQTFFLVILISTFFSSLRHILVYRSFAKKIFHGCLEDLYALLAMYMYVHMYKKV